MPAAENGLYIVCDELNRMFTSPSFAVVNSGTGKVRTHNARQTDAFRLVRRTVARQFAPVYASGDAYVLSVAVARDASARHTTVFRHFHCDVPFVQATVYAAVRTACNAAYGEFATVLFKGDISGEAAAAMVVYTIASPTMPPTVASGSWLEEVILHVSSKIRSYTTPYSGLP